jgi:thiamine thiazole synthase
MGMNEIVVQQEAIPILEAAGIRHDRQFEGLCVIDATELACALCLRAVRAGAVLLNLLTFEDLCVHDGKVTGLVVNRTLISGALPVDPIVFQAATVIDASGHEAVAVERLRRRSLLAPSWSLACPAKGRWTRQPERSSSSNGWRPSSLACG